MSRNAFRELEDKIMEDHPWPGEDLDRNVLRNISLFVHISQIAELYIPRFMGMFVDMAKDSGTAAERNDPDTGSTQTDGNK